MIIKAPSYPKTTFGSIISRYIANNYIYHNQKLIKEYYNKLTYIRKSLSNSLLQSCKKIHFCITSKNKSQRIIIDFKVVFLLLSSLSNLISLTLLNNSRIYYNNKNEILYNINTKNILA